MKETCELEISLNVNFEGYNTKKKNNMARRAIKDWVKETLMGEASFIPLYVEKDQDGASIEDCTSKSKVKVKVKDGCK